MSTPTPNPLQGYLDLQQCSQVSGLRLDRLRKATRLGELPSIKIGGTQGPRFVLQGDLEEFIAKLRQNSEIRNLNQTSL